jgi:CheY-like chemotaxis protein
MMKVLVVEDAPFVREMAVTRLEDVGTNQFSAAANGRVPRINCTCQ